MSRNFGWPAVFLGVGVVLVQAQVATAALSKADISRTAQGITVMIQDTQNPKEFGSGVIIKRDEQTYTVLTARPVVKSATRFQVMTSDNQQHPMVQGSIQRLPGVDLALIQFTSSAVYPVAKMGDSAKSLSGTASFVAGFRATAEVRSEPRLVNITSGEIVANANHPLKDGYALAYSNLTSVGMCGGPLINEQGELIGISCKGEAAVAPQNAKIHPIVYILWTVNYAVPINTFLRLAPVGNSKLALPVPSTQPVSTAPTADDYFLQGTVKAKSGNLKGAITDLDRTILINPNNAVAYCNRAVIRSDLGDKQGAINDLQKAANLFKAAGQQGDYRRAKWLQIIL